MKYVSKLLTSLVIMNAALQGEESDFNISCETISWGEVESSSDYQFLRENEEGQHRNIVRLYGFDVPKERFEVHYRRPHVTENFQRGVERFTSSELEENGLVFGEELPLFVLSSRNFLPGEKVGMVIRAKHSKQKSNLVVFTPNPLMKSSTLDGATVTFELDSVAPTTYKISFEGFKDLEKVKFKSKSGVEVVARDLDVTNNTQVIYLPHTKYQVGGVAKAIFTRESGEELALDIPWGIECKNYLEGDREPSVNYFSSVKVDSAESNNI